MRKIVALFVLLTFIVSCVMPPQGFAQSVTALGLMPPPGIMVSLTGVYVPAQLKAMTVDPNDPFKFDFIIYRGDEQLTSQEKQLQYAKLIKYFLAALAVPDTDQWVNLSPYETDRIIPDNFGLTEMGRDLLAQDYLLKQIASSLTNPDTDLGKKFWDGVYAKAYDKFGTTDIPSDTFNKVWVIPDKAEIYEKDNMVYVVSSHLKVMLDKDYLATKNNGGDDASAQQNATAQISQDVMREVIIPAIEQEVNTGKGFAPVRQVYSGMLLATWYKRALKESILARVYADKSKVKGIDQDPATNQEIYARYVQAFKTGVFNMIKEDADQYTHELIPRKYFSGGFGDFAEGIKLGITTIRNVPEKIAASDFDQIGGTSERVSGTLKNFGRVLGAGLLAGLVFAFMMALPGQTKAALNTASGVNKVVVADAGDLQVLDVLQGAFDGQPPSLDGDGWKDEAPGSLKTGSDQVSDDVDQPSDKEPDGTWDIKAGDGKYQKFSSKGEKVLYEFDDHGDKVHLSTGVAVDIPSQSVFLALRELDSRINKLDRDYSKFVLTMPLEETTGDFYVLLKAGDFSIQLLKSEIEGFIDENGVLKINLQELYDRLGERKRADGVVLGKVPFLFHKLYYDESKDAGIWFFSTGKGALIYGRAQIVLDKAEAVTQEKIEDVFALLNFEKQLNEGSFVEQDFRPGDSLPPTYGFKFEMSDDSRAESDLLGDLRREFTLEPTRRNIRHGVGIDLERGEAAALEMLLDMRKWVADQKYRRLSEVVRYVDKNIGHVHEKADRSRVARQEVVTALGALMPVVVPDEQIELLVSHYRMSEADMDNVQAVKIDNAEGAFLPGALKEVAEERKFPEEISRWVASDVQQALDGRVVRLKSGHFYSANDVLAAMAWLSDQVEQAKVEFSADPHTYRVRRGIYKAFALMTKVLSRSNFKQGWLVFSNKKKESGFEGVSSELLSRIMNDFINLHSEYEFEVMQENNMRSLVLGAAADIDDIEKLRELLLSYLKGQRRAIWDTEIMAPGGDAVLPEDLVKIAGDNKFPEDIVRFVPTGLQKALTGRVAQFGGQYLSAGDALALIRKLHGVVADAKHKPFDKLSTEEDEGLLVLSDEDETSFGADIDLLFSSMANEYAAYHYRRAIGWGHVTAIVTKVWELEGKTTRRKFLNYLDQKEKEILTGLTVTVGRESEADYVPVHPGAWQFPDRVKDHRGEVVVFSSPSAGISWDLLARNMLFERDHWSKGADVLVLASFNGSLLYVTKDTPDADAVIQQRVPLLGTRKIATYQQEYLTESEKDYRQRLIDESKKREDIVVAGAIDRKLVVFLDGQQVDYAAANEQEKPLQEADLIDGGIDFAQSNLDLQIKRDGRGIVLPLGQQDLESIRIEGLVPVILKIEPALGVQLFK